MVNGTVCDDVRHKSPTHDLETGNNKTLLLVNENGTSDTDPPHGSVTGSNGFILTKQQQQQDGSSVAMPALGVSPHRTNWLPPGSPAGEHVAKPIPASASGCAQSSGALRTDPCTGITLEQGTSDTKNDTTLSPAPAPVTIHRARKTMSRPAVSPAQKVNHQNMTHCQQHISFSDPFLSITFFIITFFEGDVLKMITTR